MAQTVRQLADEPLNRALLRDDFRHNSSANGFATLSDSKSHLVFHGDGADERGSEAITRQ